jgi:hypothetical protein
MVGSKKLKGYEKCIKRIYLIVPWPEVTLCIQRYLTYEGRYKLLYGYNFKLLIHLRHQRYVNLPYFLMHSIDLMSMKDRQRKNT